MAPAQFLCVKDANLLADLITRYGLSRILCTLAALVRVKQTTEPQYAYGALATHLTQAGKRALEIEAGKD